MMPMSPKTMTDQEIKTLALSLLHVDSEEEVVTILTNHMLWDDPQHWRLIGDDENNFKTIGNQQASPEAALVEKLVNSVDARLMSACLDSTIAPDSPDAPQTISEARTRFFSDVDQLELAKGITLAATGARASDPDMPCITICDIGEGQTPTDVPTTFMSIDKKNKLRIPFVQGKFNMGGTGALVFCGKRKLQLLITRRDPALICASDPSDRKWSMTVVRRESPPAGAGQVRNPYFKYLRPIRSDRNHSSGDVLTFSADELPLMPDGRTAYARAISFGSCIKLYNYDMRGFKGHILRKGGLLPRLEILLPEVGLPIRMHECREGFRGHEGSFAHNLIGLRARLESSRSENLEAGYPASLCLSVQGQALTAKIYAFKDDKAETYRADQGIVFTINGQTHGAIPKSFFERKKVKMGRLAKSLLIIVDCTDISVEARADLFKNSRDRLSKGELRKEIEEELEAHIASHPGLRELRESRRQREVAERLSDSKPLEDVIGSILKTSPSLSKMFLLGERLSRPFKQGTGSSGGVGSGGHKPGDGPFSGSPHPTFFHFEKLNQGEDLARTSEHGRRCRLKFRTDVENEYFSRQNFRGRYRVEVIDGVLEGRELTSSLNLYNGLANWSISIPEDEVTVDDTITLQLTVEDDVILEPFVNVARITIGQRSDEGAGAGDRESSKGSGSDGVGGSGANPGKGSGGGSNSGNSGSGNDNTSGGLRLPEIKKVRRDGWSGRGFNEYSACTIVDDGADDNDGAQSSYTFYINVDNVYLQTEIKNSNEDPAMIQAKFIYGNVLIGLALIHDSKTQKSINEDSDDAIPVTTQVEGVTRAIGPFLVPMIGYLGGLQDDKLSHVAGVADED